MLSSFTRLRIFLVTNMAQGAYFVAYKSKLSFQYGFRVFLETVVVLVCSPLIVATAKGSGNPRDRDSARVSQEPVESACVPTIHSDAYMQTHAHTGSPIRPDMETPDGRRGGRLGGIGGKRINHNDALKTSRL